MFMNSECRSMTRKKKNKIKKRVKAMLLQFSRKRKLKHSIMQSPRMKPRRK